MVKSESPPASYEPNFELPKHDVVTEENWPEYEAKGYSPVFATGLQAAQIIFGVEHVVTGNAFDFDENRPLRNKPGTGIYVSREGRKQYVERGGKLI